MPICTACCANIAAFTARCEIRRLRMPVPDWSRMQASQRSRISGAAPEVFTASSPLIVSTSTPCLLWPCSNASLAYLASSGCTSTPSSRIAGTASAGTIASGPQIR